MDRDTPDESLLLAVEQLENTKAYYKRQASLWTQMMTDSFFHEAEFRQFLRTVSPRDASVVDLGCASGLHIPLFHGIGHELSYTGVDVSHSFLEIAKDRYPNLPFYHGDLTEPDSLPNGNFDAFWCAATFMHVPKMLMHLAAKNIASICRSGAIGYLTLPKKHPRGKPSEDDTRHYEIMTPEEQRHLIADFGWKIRNETEKGGLHSPGVWQAYLVELP